MDAWTAAAASMLALSVFLLLGACWVSLRGMGGISALRIHLKETQATLERIDERITREVKSRAGIAAAEKRDDEKTLLQQAHEQLTVPATNVEQLRRPSAVKRRR